MNDTAPSRDDVLARAHAVFDENFAINVATARPPGEDGMAAPWVLGAYFTRNGDDLLLFLEDNGSSLSNLKKNPKLAFAVSQNDAMKDFLQGAGTAELLPASEYDAVMAAMKAKIPGFQLYTPCTPVRVRVERLHVSSLTSGWFPAKVLTF